MNRISFLLAGLLVGLCGCSSDSTTADDDDSICVKVRYSTADGTKDGEEACAEFPSACANADPCSHDDSACADAVNALCKDGSSRNVCVTARLNDKVTSMELGCQRP